VSRYYYKVALEATLYLEVQGRVKRLAYALYVIPRLTAAFYASTHVHLAEEEAAKRILQFQTLLPPPTASSWK
jgi:hypothetical protein